MPRPVMLKKPEVEWFYEDLQDLLGLTPKKDDQWKPIKTSEVVKSYLKIKVFSFPIWIATNCIVKQDFGKEYIL